MDENRQNEGSNVLSRCCWVSICRDLDADPAFYIRGFNLCLLLEATLYKLLVRWGHVFYPLSSNRRLSVSRRLKMYYFYGKLKSIGGTLSVRCMEVVCISESPLWAGGSTIVSARGGYRGGVWDAQASPPPLSQDSIQVSMDTWLNSQL